MVEEKQIANCVFQGTTTFRLNCPLKNLENQYISCKKRTDYKAKSPIL